MLRTDSIVFKHELTPFQLSNISLHINQGEVVSLIGPNGSGKSTLLKIMSRLIKPFSGDILIDEMSLSTMKAKDIAKTLTMLPQVNNQNLDLSVRELVEFGRYPHTGTTFKLNGEDRRVVEWAIEVTGLVHLQDRLIPMLSGGERQRAWIAMTIAQHPKILLLDEPTTYLDIAHQLEVMELIKHLNEVYNMTIVMVLHDINQAAHYSDRLVVLKKGVVQYDGLPQCVICKEMLASVFEIEADIMMKFGKPVFTPLKKCKFAEQNCGLEASVR